QSRTSSHGACKDQRVAETELLDRNPEEDRQKTGQQGDDSGDHQGHHHRTHPRYAALEVDGAFALTPQAELSCQIHTGIMVLLVLFQVRHSPSDTSGELK